MNEYITNTIKSLKETYNIELDNNLNTPIDIEWEHLKNSRIVIKKEVWEALQNIALTTQIDTKEVGFLLYGKEFLPNQVYINNIELSTSPLKSIETEFDEGITENLKTKIDENLDERTLVAHGHSHPKISDDYDKFSLKDLSNLVELTYQVEDFKTKEMQLIGCLITPDLPIKFIYYNPENNKFLDFERIEIEE